MTTTTLLTDDEHLSDWTEAPTGANHGREPRPSPTELVAMARYAIRDALIALRRSPGLAIATVTTVALAVALAGAGVLTRSAVAASSERWADGVEFVVYVQPSATGTDVARVRAALDKSDSVRRFNYVTQEQAYEEFSTMYASENAVVDEVTPELLPSSFRVTPTTPDPDTVAAAAAPLREDPAVYQVVTADDTLRDVRDLTNTAGSASTALTIALALVAIVLCTAMIRTTISTRRDEIAVMRLVGASRWYVAAPLALEGLLCGLVAAAMAAVALLGGAAWARGADSRVLTALIPASAQQTTTAVLLTAAAAAIVSMLISVGATAFALRGDA